LKALGQEARELLAVGSDVVEDVLDRGAKLGEGGVIAIAGHLALEKLPETLDQVQVRRVGWQKQQLDAQFLGSCLHWRGVVVGRIVEHQQETLAWIGTPDQVQQVDDPLGITRLPSLPTDEVLVVGRIGPKDVEAIPAGVGRQRHRRGPLDPAAARQRGVQEVCGIQEVDLATRAQRALFSAYVSTHAACASGLALAGSTAGCL
jgi:hypothetical protein